MLVSQTAPDCRASTTVDRGSNSRLDLYVDLGRRPSSHAFFSELGIDLYVDLGIPDRGHGGFTPKTKQQKTDLRLLREEPHCLPKRFDPLCDLTVDDTYLSLGQIDKLVPPDKLTAGASVAETCTDAVEAEVENVAATRVGQHMENVEVCGQCNVGSVTDPESKNGRDLYTFQLRLSSISDSLQDKRSSQEVERDATLAVDAWEDAEIVAMHGLTELRDEVRFAEEKRRCSSMDVELSHSKAITLGLDRRQKSAIFPADELQHLRLHLECLSKRVLRCQARVGRLKSASTVNRVKPFKVHMYKSDRKYKPKRDKFLCPRSHPIECECMEKPLQLTFQSVRNFL